MNTGSQNTATYNEFSTTEMPCVIPPHTVYTIGTTDWKAFTFRNTATSLYSLMTEAIDKAALTSTLQNNIYSLQEFFLERLYTLFTAESIDTSQKISLRLSEKRILCLRNDHSDKVKLDHLLGYADELAALFEEMALQSLALNHITALQELAYHYLTNQQDSIQSASLYSVNIKRDMSHFFFIAKSSDTTTR